MCLLFLSRNIEERNGPGQLPVSAGSCQNCSLVLRENQTQGQLIGEYTLQCQHKCTTAVGVTQSRGQIATWTGWPE